MPNDQLALKPVDVILNSGSGKLDTQEFAVVATQFFKDRQIDARIHLTKNGGELLAATKRAAEGDAGTVVAGGGDGTIATVAHHLIGTDKTLGVLPLGTFNYFAKNLGLPLDPAEALTVIGDGTVKSVDVGDVNGRLFLNNSSVGLYPTVLTHRESTYQRFGRSQIAAYLSVAMVLLKPPAFVKLAVTADGQLLSRRTPLLFIGANSHQMDTFGMVGRECLDARRLTMYITKPMGALALGRLGLRALFRGLRGANAFETICAGEIVIGLRRRRVKVALDGEVHEIETPLRYRLLCDALHVLVPPPAAEPA